MFFMVLLVGFGFFGPGAARAPFGVYLILNRKKTWILYTPKYISCAGVLRPNNNNPIRDPRIARYLTSTNFT